MVSFRITRLSVLAENTQPLRENATLTRLVQTEFYTLNSALQVSALSFNLNIKWYQFFGMLLCIKNGILYTKLYSPGLNLKFNFNIKRSQLIWLLL
jgi:hypothetical protein